MGNIQILTKEQIVILDEIKSEPFLKSFYFTSGTALSAFYIKHRFSEDLDFFSQQKIDTQAILTLLENWSKKHNFTFTTEFHEVVYVCLLAFPSKTIKVDFGYYPYRQIQKSRILQGILTDSLTDIAVNKLLTITQRNEVKDFVDLYFLLKKFSVWDLIEGVRIKFHMKLELFTLASDFLRVEDFTFLPQMILPLTLDQLKRFFRELAQQLGKQSLA